MGNALYDLIAFYRPECRSNSHRNEEILSTIDLPDLHTKDLFQTSLVY